MTSWLQWMEHLPSKWKAVPLRAVVDYTVSSVDKIPVVGESPVHLCNYTDVYKNEFITSELEFMQGSASSNEFKKFRLRNGDVVITKDSEEWDDIGIPAFVMEAADDLVCGYHLALLHPRPDKIDGRFLFRCLQAKMIRIHLELAANGVTRFGIPKDEIGKMLLPLPPLEQQYVINDYLDRETARIDSLIAAKGRLLELLEEKRRALIAHAVTKGLDPNAPMRDSGVPWIGEIPKHWRFMHLKRALASLEYGISESINSQGSVMVLRMGDIAKGEINFENVGFVNEVEHDLFLRPGDLVFNRTNSLDQIGKVALFRGHSEYKVSFASYLVRLRCNEKAVPEFLNLLLNSSPVLSWARSEALPAIGQANLNPNRYGYLPIAIPSIEEQQSIIDRIKSETERIDSLSKATQRTISLLKERRGSLVAEAITGKSGESPHNLEGSEWLH